MTTARRRSRLPLIRLVAKLAPVVAVAFVGMAFGLGGGWLAAAAVVAALVTVLLSVLVFRVDHRRRIEVRAARARVAADYAAEHSRYAAEHRAFTAHLVGLLDAASSRIGLLRHRVDRLESELAASRILPPSRPEPSAELARYADTAEWSDLWPDLAEAPTVVDLIAWDERMREDLLPQPRADEGHEEDEPQQRSA
jgi:hypothetical protein